MLRASVIKGDARIQLIKDSRQKLDDTRKGLHDKETLLSKHNTEYSNIGGQDYMIMATLRDLKQEHAKEEYRDIERVITDLNTKYCLTRDI